MTAEDLEEGSSCEWAFKHGWLWWYVEPDGEIVGKVVLLITGEWVAMMDDEILGYYATEGDAKKRVEQEVGE
jgi:hypothetical protein